ncbi:MAG TPA: hypothetical protein VF525_00895 [Pyrinomonadaceae bacterium]|jgi:hypothetical protein
MKGLMAEGKARRFPFSPQPLNVWNIAVPGGVYCGDRCSPDFQSFAFARFGVEWA